ncbi:MAG: hypothetical protein AAFR58_05045 [Cyanobacteria bacterium J06627_28]
MRLPIWLDLTSQQVQLHLMEGLDQWVRLGLLSDEQVKSLADRLSEPVPERVEAVSPAAGTVKENVSVGAGGVASTDVVEEALDKSAVPVTVNQKPSWVAQALGSLIEEISVLWLLFLGVFLVVVSSGVLAASQWDSFSVVGQYLVLFGYTLAFWGVSVWAQRKENLQSTGRMLSLTTLLLIPVNFWMMDRVGVLAGPVGLGAAAIAAIILTLMPLGLSATWMPRRINRVNLVALSWLHWGWGWAIWPVIATYIGTVGTAANLTYQDRQSDLQTTKTDATSEEQTSEEQLSEERVLEEQVLEKQPRLLSFDVLAVALTLLVLLVRSLFIEQVPPEQLGLAAGLCGWLLVWLTRNKPSPVNWASVGYGLLILGWAASVRQSPPLQAIAVSGLGLSLLFMRLRQTWEKGYLVALLAVGLQAYGLVWSVVPTTVRDRIVALLTTWFAIGPIEPIDWASVGFFPYLLGLLAFAFYLRRQQQSTLAVLTEKIALGFGILLALVSLGNNFTAAVNLTLSTVTLIWLLTNRRALPKSLLSLTHGAGLAAIASWIHYFVPDLSALSWGTIVLGVGIAELLYHPFLRSQYLKLNTWVAGLLLLSLSYFILLIELIERWESAPVWLWLSVPIVLTFITHHRRALYPEAAGQLALVAVFMQVPWLLDRPIDSWVAIATFAIGFISTGLNSSIWRSYWASFFTVGFGLLLAHTVLWRGLVSNMTNGNGRMLIFAAIMTWSLWLLNRGLRQRSDEMGVLYIKATKQWGALFFLSLLCYGALITAICLAFPEAIPERVGYLNYVVVAMILLVAALVEYIRDRPMEWRYWSLGWTGAVAVMLALITKGVANAQVGIVMIALGFVGHIMGDVWAMRRPVSQVNWRTSWHGIPLVFAALGWLLGHDFYAADTGLYTMAAGLLCLGIGRRESRLKLFSYLGLFGLTAGAYELLIYKLMQASGGNPGDGFTLLAMLALVLTMLYRWLGRWVHGYLRLSFNALQVANHGHWLLGSILCAIAPFLSLSQPRGITLWTVTTLLFCGYALSVGNRRWTPMPVVLDHEEWTTLGIVGGLLCFAHNRYVWFPDQTGLLTWSSAIACGIGFVLYCLPWSRLGWDKSWQRLGLWLPLIILTMTTSLVQTQGLLIIAAFYAWMAKQTSRIRLSYLSVLLFDVALIDYLDGRGWLSTLILSVIAGLSILYVAEVEPYLTAQPQRQQRHWLRILASGLVGVTALYQTEVSTPLLAYAALAVGIGIILIFTGLILKVRAYLYVGTATFVLQILRVLWLFISANSLLLWAVGIVLGLLFIWVAATFESRRSQVGSQLSSWTAALDDWE